MLIVVARDTVPDFWSIVIGNAILAAAYGLIWSGARNFEGKRVSVVLTLAGTLVWLAACSIGPIYARPEARATVMAAIAIVYALLTVKELPQPLNVVFKGNLAGRAAPGRLTACPSARDRPWRRGVPRPEGDVSIPGG